MAGKKAGKNPVAKSGNKPYITQSNATTYAGALSLAHGVGSYFNTMAQRRLYGMQAESYNAQANAAEFNAYLSKRNVRGAYEQGAFQAMLQGLQDAQIISLQKAKTGSSGVKIGSGSSKEIEASQRLNAAINQNVIQQNTTAQANKYRIEEANYLAQSIMNRGNAEASNIMAKAQSPMLSAISSIAGAASMYGMQWNMAGNNNLFSFLQR